MIKRALIGVIAVGVLISVSFSTFFRNEFSGIAASADFTALPTVIIDAGHPELA